MSVSANIQKVAAGDLITADFINQIIDIIADYDRRIALLEGSVVSASAIRILSPLPSDTLYMGSEMRIFGKGFGIPSLDTVIIDDTHRVTTFKAGSNDSMLILDIPVFVIPPTGKLVNLVVTDGRASANSSFTLRPALPTGVTGVAVINLTTPPNVAKIVSPSEIDYVFTVQTGLTTGDVFDVVVSLTNAAGWQANLVDDSGAPISTITLPAQGSTRFKIHVKIPDGVARNTTATMQILMRSRATPGYTITSSNIFITVDAAPASPPTFQLAYSVIYPPGQRTVQNNVATLTVPSQQSAKVDFIASLNNSNNFIVGIPTFSPPDPNWSANLLPMGVPSATSTATIRGPGDQTVTIRLVKAAGAGSTNVVVTVTEADNPANFGQISMPVA
jgi:hypothetical protein